MPNALTPEEVRRIAALARLELTTAEVEMFAHQLAAILDYAGRLQHVATTDAPADTLVPAAGEAELRADEVVPSLPRAAVLAEAPEADAEAGFFTVPRVLGA
jgi:aspartyl-tRNA(Asn)/glutamyl-tRNA(Gln) amidotransferase subunit C